MKRARCVLGWADAIGIPDAKSIESLLKILYEPLVVDGSFIEGRLKERSKKEEPARQEQNLSRRLPWIAQELNGLCPSAYPLFCKRLATCFVEVESIVDAAQRYVCDFPLQRRRR